MGMNGNSGALPITVQISTRNAAAGLGDCIESVRSWVSEIVVVDMESEDATCEIARSAGATVVQVPAAGWAEPGRQAGLEAATQPWILVLDVDERPGPELRALAESYVYREDVAGVEIPHQNFQFGWWVPHSGIWPDWHVRLFRRDRTTYPGHRLHVLPQVSGRLERAPERPANAIIHHSFQSISAWVKTVNHYTDLEAERLDASGRSASLVRLFGVPLARFAELYIVKRGYRGGRYGLTIALLSLCSWMLAELKLWERRLGPDKLPNDAVREPEH
jgi:glycosyltransferase involved in cell wall biosynthesis